MAGGAVGAVVGTQNLGASWFCLPSLGFTEHCLLPCGLVVGDAGNPEKCQVWSWPLLPVQGQVSPSVMGSWGQLCGVSLLGASPCPLGARVGMGDLARL